MISSDVVVSRRDTTLLKTNALVGQLPLDFEPGRRGWVHRAMSVRVAESRKDRHVAADIVKRRHYLGRWPCKPPTLALSYLAKLGTDGTAGFAMIALLPGQYHAARALSVEKYETLQLVRLWRADDLVPSTAPDFTPEMLRRIVRRLHDDWCARKLRSDGLRATPRLLISYADPARGHDGRVYAGAGATYCGRGARGKLLFAWALEERLQQPLTALGRAVLDRSLTTHSSSDLES